MLNKKQQNTQQQKQVPEISFSIMAQRFHHSHWARLCARARMVCMCVCVKGLDLDRWSQIVS